MKRRRTTLPTLDQALLRQDAHRLFRAMTGVQLFDSLVETLEEKRVRIDEPVIDCLLTEVGVRLIGEKQMREKKTR